MAKYAIEHDFDARGGKFSIKLDGEVDAKMTYTKLRDGVVAIDHTFVPPAFRGGDIAQVLVKSGVETLADQGLKMVPTCSYVVGQFKRHKDWNKFLAS